MPVIHFVKEKKKIEVPQGANLRKEAMKAGVQLSRRVKIVKGAETNVNKPGLYEKMRLILGPINFLTRLGCEDQLRLSSLTSVNGDIDVENRPGINWHGEKYWA